MARIPAVTARSASRSASRPGGPAGWLRLALGLGLMAAFFAFLTTAPRPPGKAGEIIERNLQQDVQTTALFYSDLNAMPEIEARLATTRAAPPASEAKRRHVTTSNNEPSGQAQ